MIIYNISNILKDGGGFEIQGDPAQCIIVKAYLRTGDIFAIYQYDNIIGAYEENV